MTSALPRVARVVIARFLALEDVIQWLLFALETHDDELARLLRYESAFPLAQPLAQHVVHAAASHGRFRALAALLRASPSDCGDTTSARKYVSSRWHRRFPAHVLYDAMAQIQDPPSLLVLVQWLHPRTRYDPARAVEAAARHHQLRVAQWIADGASGSPRIEVVVRLDETVQVLHWREREPTRDGSGVLIRSWFATSVHGCAIAETMRRYDDAPIPLYPAMDFAAQVGDLKLLQLLQDDTRVAWPCSTRAMDAAAARGDMAMVQWLHANRTEGSSSSAMDGAASSGHGEMVKWLYYMRQERGTGRAFQDAAANGQLKILQWQATRFPNFQLSSIALERVASHGHLNVLQWVDETKQRVRVTPAMMESAMNGGHLETVKWFVVKERAEQRDPRRVMRPHLVAQAASQADNLTMLQWLWREFRVMNTVWLSVAAESACVATVEWLLGGDALRPDEMGLRRDTLHTLAQRGHWSMLEWLLASHNDLCLACTFLPRDAVVLSRTIKHRAVRRASTPWLARYIRLVLRFVPTICSQATLPRVARWAAYHALEDMLLRVWELCRATASHKAVLMTVIKNMATPAASSLVGTIVSAHPEWIARRIIQWAATYAHTKLLDTLLVKTHPTKRFAVLRTAVFTAARHGHIGVVAWGRKNEAELPIRTKVLWRGVSLVAARHDQLRVMVYLHSEALARESFAMIQATAPT